jgi:hypothetical protein
MMGVYDYIKGHVRCPYCGSVKEINKQIKWTKDCFMYTYLIGDEIAASDGVYYHATGVRNKMYTCCNNCNEEIEYSVTVANNKLKSINVVENCDAKAIQSRVSKILKDRQQKVMGRLLNIE